MPPTARKRVSLIIVSLFVAALLIPMLGVSAQEGEEEIYRVDTDPMEYYAVYCLRDNLDIYNGEGNLLNRVPLANVLGLNTNSTWHIGRGMTLMRSGDAITVSGPQGTPGGLAPKTFSLQHCLSTNGSTPSAAAPTGTSTDFANSVDRPRTGNECVYSVRYGDTLASIAAMYNSTTTTIAYINGWTGSITLYTGMNVVVPNCNTVVPPAATTITVPTQVPTVSTIEVPEGWRIHVLLPGQNLFRVGLWYDVSVTSLIEANHITDVTRILAYTVILVPPAGTE